MIPKGNQRGGGQQLATHLMNAYDNDHIEVLEVRGSVAQDLHGAFMEWFAQSTGTKCEKYLYSLSINPDRRQGDFSRDQYLDFIARVEKRLGLAGQPRALVYHIKQDKEGIPRGHWHAVWSRIDTDTMRAVHISHDRKDLRAITQEFARDHGITLPRSMRPEKSLDASFNERARGSVNPREKQQQERSGITVDQHADIITEIWRSNTDARSFVRALEKQDYFLARGETRKNAYVVIDLLGEVHSLARRIDGVRSKQIHERLGERYPLDRLPGVTAAREYASRVREGRQRAAETKAPEKSAETKEEVRQELSRNHADRRADLNALKQAMLERHDAERKALKTLQATADKGVAENRQKAQLKGITAFLARITGIGMIIDARHRKQDQRRAEQHAGQSDALARRHQREAQELDRRERALVLVEKRENRALRASLLRDEFRAIVAPARSGKTVPELTPEQRTKVAAFRQTAAQFKAKATQHESGWTAAEFKRAAEATRPRQPERQQDRDKLSTSFKEAAAPPHGKKPEPSSGWAAVLENAADITRPAAGARPMRPTGREKDGGDREHYRKTPPDRSFRR